MEQVVMSAVNVALRKPNGQVVSNLIVVGNGTSPHVLSGQPNEDLLLFDVNVTKAYVANLAGAQSALFTNRKGKHHHRISALPHQIP
jgi:hypothetical protein